MAKAELQTELETVRKKNGGILRPAEVVAFASNPKTALHDRFEWDDTEAAKEFRLEQARQIIRFTVRLVGEKNEPIHAYVSLRSDRGEGDSYRSIVDVMEEPKWRSELLDQALVEAKSWKHRFERFTELAGVVAEIDKVARNFDRGGARKIPKKTKRRAARHDRRNGQDRSEIR